MMHRTASPCSTKLALMPWPAQLACDAAAHVQAALGEPSMVHWSASHAEVTFVGRMLGSALLAMTTWTYSLKVCCLALMPLAVCAVGFEPQLPFAFDFLQVSRKCPSTVGISAPPNS